MPAAEQPARRAKAAAPGARWQAVVRRAYLALAQRSTPQYASAQCRRHWQSWANGR